MRQAPYSATLRLIELAERLTPSGEIGDGMVQQFHEAAALARLEQNPADVLLHLASKAGRVVGPEQYQAMRDYCAEPVEMAAPYGRHADGRPRELYECD